jgi:phosphoglycolate phosphatase
MTNDRAAYDVVLFDLDGTLIDSEPGVHAAVRHALLEGFGIASTTAELEEFMGPPLDDVLPRVYGITDPADIQRFFGLYCDHYFHGTEYDFDPYPGVLDVVRDLHGRGATLGLATAKPHESASRILDHAGIADFFTVVAGSESDGSRQAKDEVVAHAFHLLGLDGSASSAVMVGDRALDVRAGLAHGADAIGVTWGYATPGELDDIGATHVVGDAAALRTVLLPLGQNSPPCYPPFARRGSANRRP